MSAEVEVVELWREPRVVASVGLARSTIWALVKQGEFPAPVLIHDGGRAVGWSSLAVQGWIHSRIAAARAKAAA
ncbi:MAG: AlpA family phage regulatory protein [Betaproteobacteria bacterium]|nr:AlpA family phage regulatory protein [Betaproteobacteria bacterium]